LAVADDQLALTSADGDHRVDRLDAGLKRLGDRLALGDARRDDVHLARLVRSDGPEAVERLTERVDDASDDRVTDGNFEQAAGRLHRVAFFNLEIVAEDDGADRIFFEVED